MTLLAFALLLGIANEPVELTPAERAQFAAEQLAEVASFGEEFAVEPPRRLRDVIDFDWIDGRLLPITPMQGSIHSRQPLIDDPARAIVHRQPMAIQPEDSSYIFQLQLRRFNPKLLEVESIDVARFGFGVMMDFRLITVDRTVHVQFTDSRLLDEEGQPRPLRIDQQITVIHSEGEESLPLVTLEAPTFTELIRRQRGAAVPILRPLFDSIGRPDVIGRALNPLWIHATQPWINFPADATERVNQLVKRLDADDYTARQNAFDSLTALGEEARLILIQLDQSNLSHEQRSSVSALLEAMGEVDSIEVDRVSNSAIDLVDGLYATHPFVREAIRVRIEQLTKLKLEIDTSVEPSIEVVEAIRETIKNLTDS